jgi:hypothetical protein
LEEKAMVVRTARFRLEAYQAYLDEQRQKLEAEVGRINQQLLARVQAL